MVEQTEPLPPGQTRRLQVLMRRRDSGEWHQIRRLGRPVPTPPAGEGLWEGE